MTDYFRCADCGERFDSTEEAYDESGELGICMECDIERRDTEQARWAAFFADPRNQVTRDIDVDGALAYDRDDYKHPAWLDRVLDVVR